MDELFAFESPVSHSKAAHGNNPLLAPRHGGPPLRAMLGVPSNDNVNDVHSPEAAELGDQSFLRSVLPDETQPEVLEGNPSEGECRGASNNILESLETTVFELPTFSPQ